MINTDLNGFRCIRCPPLCSPLGWTLLGRFGFLTEAHPQCEGNSGLGWWRVRAVRGPGRGQRLPDGVRPAAGAAQGRGRAGLVSTAGYEEMPALPAVPLSRATPKWEDSIRCFFWVHWLSRPHNDFTNLCFSLSFPRILRDAWTLTKPYAPSKIASLLDHMQL